MLDDRFKRYAHVRQRVGTDHSIRLLRLLGGGGGAAEGQRGALSDGQCIKEVIQKVIQGYNLSAGDWRRQGIHTITLRS